MRKFSISEVYEKPTEADEPMEMSEHCFGGEFVVVSAFLNIGQDIVGFSSVVTDGFLVDLLVDK